jgi:CheY-like chemotaxis protein
MDRIVRTILIVEDDAECLTMVETLLNISGYSTVTATNGAAGLVEARRHHPCLILLDLMMPVMDGIEFRGAQQQDPQISDLPVLVLSAHNEAEAIATRMGTGMLRKPLDADQLLELVDVYCGVH